MVTTAVMEGMAALATVADRERPSTLLPHFHCFRPCFSCGTAISARTTSMRLVSEMRRREHCMHAKQIAGIMYRCRRPENFFILNFSDEVNFLCCDIFNPKLVVWDLTCTCAQNYSGRDGHDGHSGRPGKPGRDGHDGQNGRNGRDGTRSPHPFLPTPSSPISHLSLYVNIFSPLPPKALSPPSFSFLPLNHQLPSPRPVTPLRLAPSLCNARISLVCTMLEQIYPMVTSVHLKHRANRIGSD